MNFVKVVKFLVKFKKQKRVDMKANFVTFMLLITAFNKKRVY